MNTVQAKNRSNKLCFQQMVFPEKLYLSSKFMRTPYAFVREVI